MELFLNVQRLYDYVYNIEPNLVLCLEASIENNIMSREYRIF